MRPNVDTRVFETSIHNAKGLQQHTDEAEYCGVGANADRQRQHRDGRVTRALAQHPQRISQISCERRHVQSPDGRADSDQKWTLRDGAPDFTFKRDAVSLETPDGTTLALPTIMEHREGNTRAIENRAKVQRDSINYFPPNASQACGVVFFPHLESRALPRDEIELTDMRACLGQLFFRIPGGIKHGQYWLNVKFANSLVRVPFRILTEDEEKLLSKNYKDISKQVKDAFKKK